MDRLGYDLSPLADVPTGVGRYAYQMLAHLRRVWAGDIVTIAHRPHLWAGETGPPIEVQLQPPCPLPKSAWLHAVLPVQLARRQVTLVHFTNNLAPVVCPCPFVVTIHDASLWLYPETHYWRRLLTMRPVLPWVARRAAAIITVSHAARQDLVRVLRIPPGKVHVVYEAPAPLFRPLNPGPWVDWARRKYTLPSRFVLFVGTLEPRKNLERLLQAFARIRPGLPHALVLVGPRGWKYEAVLRAVEALDLKRHVLFLGYVPDRDLLWLYNLADLFVFPSLYEGFGLPVVEAMACGTPVVTSNRGALAEIAGPAAELVTPTSVESIAEGMHRVLTDRARAATLRARGLARAQEFRWSKAAEGTARVYRTVASTGAPTGVAVPFE